MRLNNNSSKLKNDLVLRVLEYDRLFRKFLIIHSSFQISSKFYRIKMCHIHVSNIIEQNNKNRATHLLHIILSGMEFCEKYEQLIGLLKNIHTQMLIDILIVG